MDDGPLNHISIRCFATIGASTELVARGLVGWRRKRVCDAGLFFVSKKGGSLRLVDETRPADQLFEDPPGVMLTTSEGIAQIDVDDKEALHISTGDVSNRF